MTKNKNIFSSFTPKTLSLLLTTKVKLLDLGLLVRPLILSEVVMIIEINNTIYLVFSNLCGKDDGVAFNSFICNVF